MIEHLDEDQDFTSLAPCAARAAAFILGLSQTSRHVVRQMLEHLARSSFCELQASQQGVAGVKLRCASARPSSSTMRPPRPTGEPVVVRPTEGVVGEMPLEICDGEPGHHLDCILYQCTTYSFPDMPPQCAVKSHPGYDDAVVSVGFGLTLTDVGPDPSTEGRWRRKHLSVARRMAYLSRLRCVPNVGWHPRYHPVRSWDGKAGMRKLSVPGLRAPRGVVGHRPVWR